MTNKIPPGDYSVENGYLQKDAAGYILMSPDYSEAIATIGFSLPGIPQLEVRERSAEEVLAKYRKKAAMVDAAVGWFDEEDIVQAMEEYRSQPIAPVSEEEIVNDLRTIKNQLDHDCPNMALGLIETLISKITTPSMTSITIGEENNIIDIKYK